jgi:transcription elongation factor Elf1
MKPCPFCGCTKSKITEYDCDTWRTCVECNASTASFASSKEANAAWNAARVYEDFTRSNGVGRIAAERKRQRDKEGFTDAHDDSHKNGQLAMAGACYAMGTLDIYTGTVRAVHGLHRKAGIIERPHLVWPWAPEWDKRSKHSRLRQLEIAGALIAAEIDRLVRGGHR